MSDPGAPEVRTGIARLVERGAQPLRQPYVRVVLRRAILVVPLLFLVSALSFVLVSVTPGDAAAEILGVQASPEAIAELRQALGLDVPVQEQYWNWLRDALTGDLGTSLYSGEPVAHTIRTRVPVTLSLVASALLVTLIVGVGLGVFSAVRGGAAARFVDAFSLISFSLPVFWLSVILVMLFSVRLGWFPAVGYVPLTESPTAWLRAIALPVIALSLHGIAAIAKQTREAMLDVLASEYIRMAWVNGISARAIYFNNALKNAGIRIVTILGLQAVALLSGTVLVEVVFALPGMGSMAVNASLQHDLPVIQALVVVFTLIVVVINLVVDLLYTWLNPRVRTT